MRHGQRLHSTWGSEVAIFSAENIKLHLTSCKVYLNFEYSAVQNQ
jgi:hypothetical protein